MEELDSYNFQQLHEFPIRLNNNSINEKLLEVDSLPLNKHDYEPQYIKSKVSYNKKKINKLLQKQNNLTCF